MIEEHLPPELPRPVYIQAEHHVLSAIMWSGAGAIHELLAPADFTDPRNATIYSHLLDLFFDGLPTEPTSLLKRLVDRGQLRRGLDMPYLHEIYQLQANPLQVGFYARMILEEGERRQLAADAAHLGQISAIDDAEVRRRRLAELLSGIASRSEAKPGAGTNLDERFPALDWEVAFETDFSEIDWLPGRFMERGQQVSLIGDGKVGKSLFALDWAYRLAGGLPFLGDRGHPPIRVLYLDRENSLRDVITRAQALGAKPAALADLVYQQFPHFSGSLDASARAASELLALVEKHRIEVVIIDTVSRFIGGKENDSDTWLQLYQLIHAELKARGVACLRLDHFGKDDTRGSRGSSAKSQDVDHVWELSRLNGRIEPTRNVEIIHTTLKLARTHTRSGLGEDSFTIGRRGERQRGGMWLTGRTCHEVVDGGLVAQINHEVAIIVDQLLARGVPNPGRIGRPALKAWMAEKGIPTAKDTLMGDVVKALKIRVAADDMSTNDCSVPELFP